MCVPAAVLCAGLVAAMECPAAGPGVPHYVTIFAAEPVPFRPAKTHTFATVCRVAGGPDGRPRLVDSATISWMPADLKIRGGTVVPERGVNLSLPATLAWARSAGVRVSVWGPFACRRELYDRLRWQADRLASGAVKYKALDNFTDGRAAANCYHAIWWPLYPHLKYAAPFGCGDTSGGKTVHLFRPWLVCPERPDEPVFALLGLAGEAVIRRPHSYWPTRLDAVRSAVQAGHPAGDEPGH